MSRRSHRSETNELARTFGTRFAEALENAKKTQTAIARGIGTTPGTVSRWAAGKKVPGVLAIRKIAVSLDVSADWLLGLPAQRPKPKPRKVDPAALKTLMKKLDHVSLAAQHVIGLLEEN